MEDPCFLLCHIPHEIIFFRLNDPKYYSESSTRLLFLVNCELTRYSLQTELVYWSLCQLSHAFSLYGYSKRFYVVFCGETACLAPQSVQHLCLYERVWIQQNGGNGCFRRIRFLIELFKPLLSFNGSFFYHITVLSRYETGIFSLLWKISTSAALYYKSRHLWVSLGTFLSPWYCSTLIWSTFSSYLNFYLTIPFETVS